MRGEGLLLPLQLRQKKEQLSFGMYPMILRHKSLYTRSDTILTNRISYITPGHRHGAMHQGLR